MGLFGRPDRTTMEGMIWNANHVLEQASSPNNTGVPKVFFEQCVGLVLISVVEVGFIFSGNVGTGIILKKRENGTWSEPCACGLTGVGYGFLLGGSVKDLLIFIMDDDSFGALTSENGLKLGVQSELTVGPFGRTYAFDAQLGGRGFGPTVSVAFSKGAFMGISCEGAVVGIRHGANKAFYGAEYGPRDILLQEKAKIPADKVTLLDEVYKKLDILGKGLVHVVAQMEEEKKKAAKAAADAAAEEANKSPDVVKVDVTAEASKAS